MITDADITKLKTVFATKQDLAEVQEEFGDLRVEVGEIKEVLHEFRDEMRVTLDRVTGAIHDQHIENGAGAAHLARHDRQIAALAAHTQISLPD